MVEDDDDMMNEFSNSANSHKHLMRTIIVGFRNF